MACRAAASSSAKKGLPPERDNTASTRVQSGEPPTMSVRSLAISHPVETGQLELRDARVPAELGEETAKRAASFDLVSSVRGNHQHRVVVQVAGQEVDYFDAGGVGPLQVLEDEHYRRPGGQGLDALQQGLEHLRLDEAARGRRVDVTRKRRSQAEGSLREAEHCPDVTCRQLTCDVSQHTNNWTVRKSAAFGRSAGAESPRSCRGFVRARRTPRSGGTCPCRRRRRARPSLRRAQVGQPGPKRAGRVRSTRPTNAPPDGCSATAKVFHIQAAYAPA